MELRGDSSAWQGTSGAEARELFRLAEEVEKKAVRRGRAGPQRLKPRYFCGTYGTSELVPYPSISWPAGRDGEKD